MKTLSIDIETYSPVPIAQTGVYPYAAHPDFEVLLFAYSADQKPVRVVDLAQGEQIPEKVLSALTDPKITKFAFNAQFERVCLSAHLGQPLDPQGWKCTMVWAASLGLPLSLDGVAKVLRLKQQKLSTGKALIRRFCGPVRPSKANGMRTRNTAQTDPERWAEFKEYNRVDVQVELAIQQRLTKHPVPTSDWEDYWLDQTINDRGINVDLPFVEAAIATSNEHRTEVLVEARALTGLENPNSVTQLLDWLHTEGAEIPSLAKADVQEALETVEGPVREALEQRVELSKSSVKKFEAMTKVAGVDGRARGLFQFLGANRTGRWAGRLVQLQNLPRNYLPDLDVARALVREGNGAMLEPLYGSVPDTLSQLVRTAFTPKDGRKFVVADYSAIEARVIAWLAGEQWVLDLFDAGGDIYCATGTRMFREEVTKQSPLRQKAKVAVLACGYGGSVGALKAMGALEQGIPEDELQPLVDGWRDANPRIVRLWWAVDEAVKQVVGTGTPARVGTICFHTESGILFITLPSGRRLAYPQPKPGVNKFGGECVTYLGVGLTRKWERIDSYGPKFVENIVQAVARDLLAAGMARLEAAGHRIVMHVHDEVVVEAPSTVTVEEVCDLLAQTPPWASGLPMDADGFETSFYKKD